MYFKILTFIWKLTLDLVTQEKGLTSLCFRGWAMVQGQQRCRNQVVILIHYHSTINTIFTIPKNFKRRLAVLLKNQPLCLCCKFKQCNTFSHNSMSPSPLKFLTSTMPIRNQINAHLKLSITRSKVPRASLLICCVDVSNQCFNTHHQAFLQCNKLLLLTNKNCGDSKTRCKHCLKRGNKHMNLSFLIFSCCYCLVLMEIVPVVSNHCVVCPGGDDEFWWISDLEFWLPRISIPNSTGPWMHSRLARGLRYRIHFDETTYLWCDLFSYDTTCVLQ